MIKKTIMLLLCLLSFNVVAEDVMAIQQLKTFLENTKSLSARFQQKLVDEYGGLMQQSAGTLDMQKPGKFRWDYILPYSQNIISNGKKIWMYDSELEQVNVLPYDQLKSSPVNLLDNQKLDEQFVLESLPFTENQYWVRLTPKSTESDFKKMLVGLQNGKIKSMRFRDNFNQQTDIEFEQLVVNPKFKKDNFEFIAPEGTDVMGDC
jgi:outer membrane lipoprotein carrier protein